MNINMKILILNYINPYIYLYRSSIIYPVTQLFIIIEYLQKFSFLHEKNEYS